MSKGNELARVDGVNIVMNVDKDDLVAIAVNKRETELRNSIERKAKEIRDIEKQVDGLLSGLTKSIEKAVEKEKCANKAAKALKDLGLKVDVKKDGPHTESFVNGREDEITLRIYQKNCGSSFVIRRKLKVTADMNQDRKQILALREAREKVQDDIIGERKKLAELSTIERAAKANIAKSVLRKTEEGKRLLKSIELEQLCLPESDK
jgi:hypothetical protein